MVDIDIEDNPHEMRINISQNKIKNQFRNLFHVTCSGNIKQSSQSSKCSQINQKVFH